MSKENLQPPPNQQSSPTQHLIEHLAREQELFDQKVINTFSDSYDLASLYKLHPNYVNRVARTQGYSMTLRRNQAQERRKEIYSERLITPGSDTAWFLGILCGSGSVTGKGIMLSSQNTILADRFQETGESILQITGHKTVAVKANARTPSTTVSFNDVALGSTLAKLRRDSWPDDIISKYPWILSEDVYGWKFFEGFFETRGTITPRNKFVSIRIATYYMNVANFISALLVRLGLNQSSIRLIGDKDTHYGIAGIGIYQNEAIRYIAQRIKIIDDKKREKLRHIIEASNLRSHHHPDNYTQLLAEWDFLKEMLGKNPRYHEIVTLNKKGLTRFTAAVYRSWFTSEDTGGSFSQAQSNIKVILQMLESGELVSPEDIPSILPQLPKVESRKGRPSSKTDSEQLPQSGTIFP